MNINWARVEDTLQAVIPWDTGGSSLAVWASVAFLALVVLPLGSRVVGEVIAWVAIKALYGKDGTRS